VRLGIIGNKYYYKKLEIKEFLWKIKQRNDDEIKVISIGRKSGADKYIRDYCLQFNINYGEFIPYHENYNSFCIEERYMFSREYSPKYYFAIYKRFVDYCDNFVIFEYSSKRDDVVTRILKTINKQNKYHVILQE